MGQNAGTMSSLHVKPSCLLPFVTEKVFFGKRSVLQKHATWRNVCRLQHVRWRLLSSTVETTTNCMCINLAVRLTKVKWYRTNQNTKHSDCGNVCCNVHSPTNVKMWYDVNKIETNIFSHCCLIKLYRQTNTSWQTHKARMSYNQLRPNSFSKYFQFLRGQLV